MTVRTCALLVPNAAPSGGAVAASWVYVPPSLRFQSSARSKRKVSWSATCGPCGDAGKLSVSPRATSLLTE
jgi:hypothetical protein